jgi:ribonuclease D
VALSKESQLDDWSRRPLTPAQERYALEDVRHLLPLQRRLEEKLRALGRLEWVREECEVVAALEAPPRRRDPEAWQKVKGARALSRRQQAALRELFAWREEVAERTDRPPFKVLGNETLLALARRAPRNPAELGQVRGVLPRLSAEAPRLLEALRRAAELPDRDLPAIPHSPRPPVPSDETRARIAALRDWRARTAQRLGLDVSVVLPQRLVDRVAETVPAGRAALEHIEGLRRWRVETFGDGILGALSAAGRR